MFFLFAILFSVAQAATPKLDTVIDGIDRTLGRMKDLSADFEQIEENPLNRRPPASGHLYLMKPRMMRMEYRKPDEQLFVSDGKTIYWYVPADHQVRKDSIRESTDDRIPLALVVGHADLRGEFTRFESVTSKPVVPGTFGIKMIPKRKMDFTEFAVEVEPQTFKIRRLVATKSDGSRSEYIFSNVQTDSGLKPSLFHFTPPAGVEVIEGAGR